MAKSPRAASEQEGEISVSMVKFTMKGSDASLQKGLDTIKAALAQAGFAATAPEVRYLRSPASMQLPASSEEPEGEVGEQVDDAAQIEDAKRAAPQRQKKSVAPKKAPNYKIINDLKFDDVDPTLKEFIAEKDPKTDLNKYLCIAYWFKHHKRVEDLTTEHFFTVYMTHKWTLPANAGTPVRDLRNGRRQWLVAGKSPGMSTISNAGERRVQEMGKAES